MSKAYRWKFLNTQSKNIVSAHGSLNWKVGEWNKVDGGIELCENGLHCSKKIYEAFGYVQGEVLAQVEVRGNVATSDDKEAYSEMRIVKAYKWAKKDSVALSIFSAELCLKEFEKLYPNDTRPRDAIEAAKAVLLKDTAANRKKAAAARSAARSAAWSAAESAAESAARSAESAAWSAARSAESAARSAARSAAESAARSAESAAWSAARSAARSAAWSAARKRTINKIEKWLNNHISEMEEIK